MELVPLEKANQWGGRNTDQPPIKVWTSQSDGWKTDWKKKLDLVLTVR